jgi:hypothetical protein
MALLIACPYCSCTYASSLHPLPGQATCSLTVCSYCTSVPVHTRRILLPGPATRSLTVCSWCTGVPVHTRPILLPDPATHSLTVSSKRIRVPVHAPHATHCSGHSVPERLLTLNSLKMVCSGLRTTLASWKGH